MNTAFVTVWHSLNLLIYSTVSWSKRNTGKKSEVTCFDVTTPLYWADLIHEKAVDDDPALLNMRHCPREEDEWEKLRAYQWDTK
jgi:hypothetical protein